MKAFLFTIILTGLTIAYAQNPFAKYGYEPKIATLSQGKYNEFFDQDTIVQIGHALFNTKSRKLVGFVEYDTVYSEATLEPDIVSRWLSPDPLAAEYTSWSPYNFVKDNPIIFIDPDGKDPEPSAEKIQDWFRPRKQMILKVANKYNIEAKYIAAVLFRENQNFMSTDKAWTKVFIAKETLAMLEASLTADYEGDLDRWSSGIAQMQIKLVVRMKLNMTVEAYDNWKAYLNSTEEGKLEYIKVVDAAISDMFDNEIALDYLGKYIKQLLDKYPNSTPEQIIEDYARGPHISRDENKEQMSKSLSEDIKRYKKFKDVINKSISTEEQTVSSESK